MTIEEKYKSALELFRSIQIGMADTALDPNHVQISNETLRNNELAGTDFWEIICPRLEAEGILAYYPKQSELQFIDPIRERNFIDEFATSKRRGRLLYFCH
jgi:hypothetical protein